MVGITKKEMDEMVVTDQQLVLVTICGLVALTCALVKCIKWHKTSRKIERLETRVNREWRLKRLNDMTRFYLGQTSKRKEGGQ